MASSQEERRQLQNRETAMRRLKTMIAAKIEEERERSSTASPVSRHRSAGAARSVHTWCSRIKW